MKAFLVAALFVSSSAFAGWDVCSLQDSHDIIENHTAVKTTEAGSFTPAEDKIIFDMMKTYSKGWRSYKNEYEAVFDFEDRDHYNDRDQEPGSNAGEIIYYKIENKTIALLHFYPGDNEYGAVYEISAQGKFRSIALINDGEIVCK